MLGVLANKSVCGKLSADKGLQQEVVPKIVEMRSWTLKIEFELLAKKLHAENRVDVHKQDKN